MIKEVSRRVLTLDAKKSIGEVKRIAKGLASDSRLEILNLLGNGPRSANEIADLLHIPGSTTTLHINVLDRSGLIETQLVPARRGLQKICSRRFDRVVIDMATNTQKTQLTAEVSMPLGAYTDIQVSPYCGLAGELGIIGLLDDPAAFYEPDHIYAELLWFRYGYVEYRFPNRLPPHAVIDSLHLSMEICSAAPVHSDDWPSDITIWMNDREIGSWTCPSDFGEQHGSLTPAWWEDSKSQHGLLKVWKVTRDGSFVDGIKVSEVTCEALHLNKQPFIAVRIGVKPNDDYVGGVSLFGSSFGNYPQHLVMTFNYKREHTL